MMHRQFGSQNHDHTPPGGYPELAPRFYSDRVGLPYAAAPQTIPFTYKSSSETHDMAPDSPAEAENRSLQVLPVDRYAPEIVRSVEDHNVTIIVSPTGTGKSTRVAPMLKAAGRDRVMLLEPRRIASEGIFSRIKDERAILKGVTDAENYVSFRTGGPGERDGPDNAPICVFTDGLYLVKDLGESGIRPNEVLIIDELHEWNDRQEAVLAWYHEKHVQDPSLRLVIMSADVEIEPIVEFFSDNPLTSVNIIRLTEKMYDVETIEAPDSTAMRETLKMAIAIHEKQKEAGESIAMNGILVFMPGKNEIDDLIQEVSANLPAEVAQAMTILPLHADVSLEDRKAALAHYEGGKIVVATNIAETSLTISDIGCVIDSGYVRQKELDDSGFQGLMLRLTSQASGLQRKGRTGRVEPGGIYIHTRLDDKPGREFVPYSERPMYSVAEILRTDIVRTALRLAGVGFDVEKLRMVHQVKPETCVSAKNVLRGLGALACGAEITPLGVKMNEYTSLRAQLSLMVVESLRYSPETRAYVTAIAAAIESGGLRKYNRDGGTEWKYLTEDTMSDPLAQLDIFIAMYNASDKELADNDLSIRNFKLARETFHKINRKHRIHFDELLPPSLEEREDVRKCILKGFRDSIYVYAGNKTYRHLGTDPKNREISRRSNVSDRRYDAVIGDPYRVEKYDGTIVDILENPMAVTLADIGRIATETGKATWRSDGFKLSKGGFVEVRRQYFHGTNLGTTEEVIAEPSPRLREAIIAHVLEHPLGQQKHLRGIKKQLEKLKHLAKDPVETLTHDAIKALVERAAPANITDPTLVDHNLRTIIAAEGISLENYVSSERQVRIVADAPSELTTGDNDVVTLKLDYRNGLPIARHYRESDIFELNDEVFLPDGRQVYFSNPEGRRCTLLELKSKIFEAIAQY